MANNVHSFSTKNDKDEKLIQELKRKARKTGISFSWLVVRAIENNSEVNNEVK